MYMCADLSTMLSLSLSPSLHNLIRSLQFQEMDYGTIMCWADNAVGQQKEPCVFHVIAAGKPDAPYNCTLINQTSDGLEVDCTEGK